VTVAYTKSPHFQWRIKHWENPEVAGSQMWDAEVLTDLDEAIFLPIKACTRALEWAGALMHIH